MDTPTPLRRILGLGFGVAFAFGTMIGVGILRLPGMVAAATGSAPLMLLCWAVGGVYAIMGAVSVAELAAMFPEAGGMRVYVRQAFGDRAAFILGWIDWLGFASTGAYAAVSAADFFAILVPAAAAWGRPVALAFLAAFTVLHALGLRTGRTITMAASVTIGVLFLVLIAACFVAAPAVPPPVPSAAGTIPALASLVVIVPAMRAIVLAYDGWYAPIYTAEESLDAARTLPRALIGTAIFVTVLYVAINAALVKVLGVSGLAASSLPAAAAAGIVLPHGSDVVLTVLSLVIVMGLLNVQALCGPRILLSLAREGWLPTAFAAVSPGGTPQTGLLVTMAGAAFLVLTGSFEQIITLFAVFTVLMYVLTFASVFRLRRLAPGRPRPFRAWGYPLSTGIVLLGSLAFLVAAFIDDWRTGLAAIVFLMLSIPAFAAAKRTRRVVPSG